MKRLTLSLLCLVTVGLGSSHATAGDSLREQAVAAMKRAATHYHDEVATHGGYVYFYTLDLKVRMGEGLATPDQIWVQPPGTPTVGMAFLKAFQATGDEFYLNAGKDSALALVYGQLKSGGWTNCIDFNPRGDRVSQYRHGGRRGKNNTSLDDGQTQSAIQLLIHADKAFGLQNEKIHEASQFALNALLNAQFPNGAFPQVWTGPTADQAIVEANYPNYDWRTEGRIKEYWNMYTLNDNVCGYVAETLIDAHRVYNDNKYLDALKKLGDFLVLAQMPNPQPAWAQQYNYNMQPIWARKFEPPGISGDETQEAIETLIRIAEVTGDKKYLQPIPAALTWLKKSVLPGNQLARYYELKTNKPLYMFRRGKVYTLTYDDSNLPKHYGWKTPSRIAELERAYQAALRGETKTTAVPDETRVRKIIAELDSRGRWTETYSGERLVGQPKMKLGTKYLSSEEFSENITALSEYVKAKSR